MKLIVLIKEVPDMDRVIFDKEKGVVNRASAGTEMNPLDRHALQVAVNIKEHFLSLGIDCNIEAMTMGPPTAEKTLRDAYARGADSCVLLTDRAFGGSDTLATARTIAAAIKTLHDCPSTHPESSGKDVASITDSSNEHRELQNPPDRYQGIQDQKSQSIITSTADCFSQTTPLCDLILCGEKSVDGDTAQVGAEVAAFLQIPHCCCADKIEIQDDGVIATIPDLCGVRQVRKLNFPALISLTKNASTPMYATVKRKLASLTIDVKRLELKDLFKHLTPLEVGFSGSPTKVRKIEVVIEATREAQHFDSYEQFSKLFLTQINSYSK